MMTYEDLEKMYSKKIRHLMIDDFWGRVDWDVYDPFDDTTTHYHTGDRKDRKCGLWIGWDYTDQIEGTCDFVLSQETKSGMRRFLRKYFND